jgi:hypothetical protein
MTLRSRRSVTVPAHQFHAPVAQQPQSGRLRTGGSQVQFLPGVPFPPRRSPTAETLRSERRQCGCESCRRDHFRSRIGDFGLRMVTQTREAFAVRYPSWNVNRASEPGLSAKEIGPVFTAPGEHAVDDFVSRLSRPAGWASPSLSRGFPSRSARVPPFFQKLKPVNAKRRAGGPSSRS